MIYYLFRNVEEILVLLSPHKLFTLVFFNFLLKYQILFHFIFVSDQSSTRHTRYPLTSTSTSQDLESKRRKREGGNSISTPERQVRNFSYSCKN
jgi:hypothetical protein